MHLEFQHPKRQAQEGKPASSRRTKTQAHLTMTTMRITMTVAAMTLIVTKTATGTNVETANAMTDNVTHGTTSHKTKLTEDAADARPTTSSQRTQNQTETLSPVALSASHEKYGRSECPRASS